MQTSELDSSGYLGGSNHNFPANTIAAIQPDAVSWGYEQFHRQIAHLFRTLQALNLTEHDTIAVAPPTQPSASSPTSA